MTYLLLLRLPRALAICTLIVVYLLLSGAALLITACYFALTSESSAEMNERLREAQRVRERVG